VAPAENNIVLKQDSTLEPLKAGGLRGGLCRHRMAWAYLSGAWLDLFILETKNARNEGIGFSWPIRGRKAG